MGKKKVRHRPWTVYDGLLRTKKPFIPQAGLLTCGSASVYAFPGTDFLGSQWQHVDLVPAYSAGPTLRILTVFPFHHVAIAIAAPGRLW